jgi:hypothetical protein
MTDNKPMTTRHDDTFSDDERASEVLVPANMTSCLHEEEFRRSEREECLIDSIYHRFSVCGEVVDIVTTNLMTS